MAPPTLADPMGGHPDALTLFVLGPGVGECQVLLLPDRHAVVVDACMRGPRNLTVELLQALGVATVDLLVITHPDKDHVRGAAGVLQQYPPTTVWTFPTAFSLRSLMVRAKEAARAQGLPVTDALRELTELLERMQKLPREQCFEVRASTRPWKLAGGRCVVTPIAPATADEQAEAAWMETQLGRPPTSTAPPGPLVPCLEAFLNGQRRAGDHPNHLSLALSVEFHAHRVLLGGNVERHPTAPERGWSGVMQMLAHPAVGQSGLLASLTALKVAHHGSVGAIHDPAWAAHVNGGARPFAVIAPYAPSPLPERVGLKQIRQYQPTLAITETSPATQKAAHAVGWQPCTPPRQPEDFPMVALCIPPTGPATHAVWGTASVWR